MHEEILADLVVMMYVKGSDGRGSGVPVSLDFDSILCPFSSFLLLFASGLVFMFLTRTRDFRFIMHVVPTFLAYTLCYFVGTGEGISVINAYEIILLCK